MEVNWWTVIAAVINGLVLFVITFYLKKILERIEKSREGKRSKDMDNTVKKLRQKDNEEAKQIKELADRLDKVEKQKRGDRKC
jgi:cell division protein FtsB